MSELASKHCSPPEGNPLNKNEAEELLSSVKNDWKIGDDQKSIAYDFTFKNFYETMAFVNAVAWIANREDHHPDLEVGYKHCRVQYSTHAVGGLSENDFICAAKIDNLLS